MGFAFVQFETKDDADKVIEEFNGKEFKGRKVYVKKAVPPPTEEEKQKKLEEFRAKTLAAKEKKKKAAAEAAAAAAAATASAAESADAATAEADGATGGTTESKKKKPAKKRSPRPPKLPLEEGTKSTDTVFITNLPFDANIKTLTGVFKDYKPVWIHVPLRKPPYRRSAQAKVQSKPQKNKGIAFIKFSDEDLQKKAIEEFNGIEIGERKIVVDVAVDARIPIEGAKEENGEKKGEEKEAKEEAEVVEETA